GPQRRRGRSRARTTPRRSNEKAITCLSMRDLRSDCTNPTWAEAVRPPPVTAVRAARARVLLVILLSCWLVPSFLLLQMRRPLVTVLVAPVPLLVSPTTVPARGEPPPSLRGDCARSERVTGDRPPDGQPAVDRCYGNVLEPDVEEETARFCTAFLSALAERGAARSEQLTRPSA